jgi:hypothetical protein
MDISSMELNRGWGLFGRGWNNFKTDPLTWVLVVVIFFLISLVLNLIPLLGGVLMAIISPALVAGLMKIAHDIEQGEKVGVGHLFQPIQDSQRRVPATAARPRALLATVVMGVLMAVFVGSAVQMGAAGDAVTMPMAGMGFLRHDRDLPDVSGGLRDAGLLDSAGVLPRRGTGGCHRREHQGHDHQHWAVGDLQPDLFRAGLLRDASLRTWLLILGPVALAAVYGAYTEIFPGSVEPEVLEAEEA